MLISIITWSSLVIALLALGGAVFGFLQMRKGDALQAARGKSIFIVSSVVTLLFSALFAVGLYRLRTVSTVEGNQRTQTNGSPSTNISPGLTPRTDRPRDPATPPRIIEPVAGTEVPRMSPTEGVRGRIVTLVGGGFGNEPGSVQFVDTDGKETRAALVNASECTPTPWGDTAILITVPDVTPDTYTIIVRRADGKTLPPLSFRVTNLGTRTSICRIDPESGIPNVTQVTMLGSELGKTPGKVYFGEALAQSIVSWSERAITVRVPIGATTGTVRVVTKDGVRSNEFAFTIGQCTGASCRSGESCCGDGLCRKEGTCPVSGACRYRWYFSTGATMTLPCGANGTCPSGFQCDATTKSCTPLRREGPCIKDAECPAGTYCQKATGRCVDGTPRLIEEPGCVNTIQSPTPYRGRIDACTNARFGARFSVPLDSASLNDNALELRQCGTAVDFQETSCTTRIPGLFVSIPGQDGTIGFLYQPAAQIQPETWYTMSIKKSLQSVAGISIGDDIIWRARTGKTACTLDHIEVTPSRAIVVGIDSQQSYRALPTAKNCNVIPDRGPWAWVSKDENKASLTPTVQEEVIARARAATTGDGVSLEALLQKKKDTGSLVVRLLAPKLIEWWPSCSSACRNAELGLRFSGPMRLPSVNEKTVRLEACGDTKCAVVTPVALTGFSGAEGDTVIRFRSAKGLLAPGMTYRMIVLASELKGRDGVALAGVESKSGSTITTTNERYSWTFRTLDTRAVCSVDHVAVAPERATLTAIFAKQDFSAVPRSKSDTCDAQGQRLIADGYAWAWATSEERVAALIDDKAPGDALQRVEARGSGQSAVSAETGGKRGIGTVSVVCDAVDDRSCGAEHGVGIDRCCYPRPKILTKQPEGDKACRNGVIEVRFDQPMDKGIVEKGTIIEQEMSGPSCAGVAQQKKQSPPGPNAKPVKKVFCPLTTRLTASSDERIFTFAPVNILPEKAVIRVRVFGMDADAANSAVKNRAGVAMAQGVTWNFTTGSLICRITSVRVFRDPAPIAVSGDTFLCSRGDNCADDMNVQASGNQHQFRAAAFDQEEHAVQATYVWTLQDPRIASGMARGSEVEVTGGENGRTALEVAATATNGGGGKGKVVIPIDVTACANPWPARTTQGATTLWEPFADQAGSAATNFSTYYCRDRGGPELDDDLPALSWPPGIETGFEGDPKKKDFVKGFLFQVVGGGEPDAIGFEIFRNQEKKDTQAWYREIFKNDNQNTPEPLTVNGYPALRDGRTVYVNALNIQGAQVIMQVHLLSYGLGASEDTIAIARQLEQNWRFTTSITDDRDRAALQRDVTRVIALNGMRAALNTRGAPKLEAGSFIPGLTFSTWPLSWGRLGALAGASFPRDPANQFEGCTKPFDPSTCWNPVRKKVQPLEPLVKQFKCPKKAFAYGYTIDPSAPGGYILATNFEYDGPGSFKRDPSYRSLDSLLGSGVCTK